MKIPPPILTCRSSRFSTSLRIRLIGQPVRFASSLIDSNPRAIVSNFLHWYEKLSFSNVGSYHFLLSTKICTEVNPEVSEIGKRLAVVRESAGYSQIPFAEKLGVSQSSYKNYERGASPVPVGLVSRICEEYDVSPAWLLLGEGQIKSEMNGELVEAAVLAVEKFAQMNDLEPPLERKAKLIRFVYEEVISGRDFGDKELRRIFNTVL